MRPEEAIYIPWLVWMVSWFAAAGWSNRTVNRAGFGSEILYRAITVLGFVLLFFSVARPDAHGRLVPIGLGQQLWTLPDDAKWAMVALAALGFVLCWWARLHLGRLWSGSVTRKEGHHIVDSGPYRIVRHPIYTGVILAALATMVLRGTAATVAGTPLIIFGFWLKAKIEERFLRKELGPAPYDAYAAKTAMLIPFLL